MGAKTIMNRLKTRFVRNVEAQEDQEWDVPTEVYIPEKFPLETINTELVSQETIMVCLHCGFRNYLKNMKCIKCDYLIP